MIKNKTMKRKFLIIFVFFLMLSCLLCILGKFPIMLLNGKVYTIFSRELKLDNEHGNEKFYDNDDVEFLSRMKFVKNLEMRHTQITNLSFLENMESLKRIFYRGQIGFPVDDWSYLKECKNLTIFCGERMNISDLSAFSGLTNLEELYIESEFGIPLAVDTGILVSDLSALKTLTNLRKCFIVGENISDISALKYCQKITNLGVRGTTPEADYSVLVELPELISLNIGGGVLPKDIKKELLEKGVEVYEYES